MALKCIIIEDSELERELITAYVDRTDFLELAGVFCKAIDAQKYIITHTVDLIISDIGLPDITGLQYSQRQCIDNSKPS
jgi:response regulator of citrate/malate metabolism